MNPPVILKKDATPNALKPKMNGKTLKSVKVIIMSSKEGPLDLVVNLNHSRIFEDKSIIDTTIIITILAMNLAAGLDFE